MTLYNRFIFYFLYIFCMGIQSQGPSYEVPTGRRDGLVSNMFLANDMPEVEDSIQELKAKFSRRGLTNKDLVVLSGICILTL